MADLTTQQFVSGVHNLIDDENIPQDAASDAKNWITKDGRTQLSYGQLLIGAAGTVGNVSGEHFGYKTNGEQVHYRKIGTKIQYLNGTTWTDVITGLTSSADYTFANYSSLAGAFTYIGGADGLFKIVNANPGSYTALYDSAKNFKGDILINQGRMFLWNRAEDKTGLYGSKIDKQITGAPYVTVTAEVIADVASGTLAFKAGGATRTCFAVTITDTSSGEIFRDNYDGTLTGSISGTGTINYTTGAFTITGQSGGGTADYQYENSNSGGITDFTHANPRLASEGFVFPQDEGGDAIQIVLVGQDGNYYSLKRNSAYSLSIDAADTNAENLLYRKDIGVPTRRAAVSTNKGIVFLNTANPSKPVMTILQRNVVGDAIEPFNLFPHFKFENYVYDDCSVDTYDRYITVFCKTSDATSNDTILLCDTVKNTVDITSFPGRVSSNSQGVFYVGSSITQSTFELYSGFDDDSDPITNYWISRNETYQLDTLKKFRRLRLKGKIGADQRVSVYINYDSAGFQLVGTIRGDGSYVDYAAASAIGTYMVGDLAVGGDSGTFAYPYFMELKIPSSKFRTRQIMLVAESIGYIDVDQMTDWDILNFEARIPKRFRSKQNVSLDGTQTDQ